MFEIFFFQKGSGRDHASCSHAGGKGNLHFKIDHHCIC